MKKYLWMNTILLALLLGLYLPGSAQGTKLGTQKVSGLNPQQNYGVDNHFLLREADRQLRLLDFEQASFTLDNAVAQQPQSVTALVQRAKYFKMLGRAAEAEADIRLVNRMNPYAADLFGYNGPQGVLNLIALQPEQALLSPELDQLLIEYYQMLELPAFQRTELKITYEYLYGSLLQLQEGSFAAALISLEELLAKQPDSGLAYELKGLTLIQQQQYELAAEALAQAVALRPEAPTLWYNYCQLEREQGYYQLAKAHIDQALELDRDFSAAYFLRANLHKALGDSKAAIDDYNRIIELQGDDTLEALFNRGLTRKMTGDFRGALADLNLVLNALPNEADLYKNRANLHLLFGYTNLAIQDYTEAIGQDANFAEAYYNRGLAHLLRYDPISGCYDLQKSADLGYEPAAEKQRYFWTE